MTRAVTIILVILGACLLALWLIVLKADTEPEPAPAPEPVTTTPTTAPESATASVEAYVRANIRQLSPEPEVLGGTFFVTDIEVRDDGTGTVSYEDGHNAYTAEFTYSIDSVGQPHIDTFTVE